MPITPKRRTGNAGEDRACQFLSDHGYDIVARNVTCQKYGEIDIVATKGGVYHFIEVKTRETTTYGEGVEAVDERKLPKVIRSAQWYMATVVREEVPFQIDVISIDVDRIQFFENVTFG